MLRARRPISGAVQEDQLVAPECDDCPSKDHRCSYVAIASNASNRGALSRRYSNRWAMRVVSGSPNPMVAGPADLGLQGFGVDWARWHASLFDDFGGSQEPSFVIVVSDQLNPDGDIADHARADSHCG